MDKDVGCFCISNANVDRNNEMYIDRSLLPIIGMNPRDIVRNQEKMARGQRRNQNLNQNTNSGLVVITSNIKDKNNADNMESKFSKIRKDFVSTFVLSLT